MSRPHFSVPTIFTDGGRGFTLIETMIVIVVSAVISLATYSIYQLQSTTYSSQREVASMQQELRGSLYILAWDIRNALRDTSPQQRNRFMTGNMSWVDSNGNASNDPFAAFPTIYFDSMIVDQDNDGIFDETWTIAYRIFDEDGDGIPGLYRSGVVIGNAEDWQLVADGVQAINFAYALDSNQDNRIERYNTSPNANGGNNAVIWAVDSDNDQRLDSILDPNGDNNVDQFDDTSGDFLITFADDANLATHLPNPVDMDRVRAVRIDLLMVSARPFNDGTVEQKVYTVGNRIYDYSNGGNMAPDRFKRRTMTIEVALRNYIR